MTNARTKLDVKVFSDYICPFCYIGSERLFRLSDEFDLLVDWLYFEIHPDTPTEGMPVDRLGYMPEHWQRLMASLQTMAIEEGITIAERTFTTNSHKAML
ncbi:MAG: DsbA family oxidoreductase, partial [Gammaproteobacteria bacterium]